MRISIKQRWVVPALAGTVAVASVLLVDSAPRMRMTPTSGASPRPDRRAATDCESAPATQQGARPVEAVPSPAAQAPAPNPDRVFPVRARPVGDTSWRERIGSSDPGERAEAVDAIPYAPGADGVAILEQIVRTDPDEGVRERAVMAFTQALGNAALPVLREVGRAERGTDVGAAVRASLQLIEEYDPLPRRSSMEIGTASAPFRIGEWFPVTFRVRSEQAVPDARLSLSGRGLHVARNRSRVWKGALEAGQAREITVLVRAEACARPGRLRARLKCDYAEELDVESTIANLVVTEQDGGIVLIPAETAAGSRE